MEKTKSQAKGKNQNTIDMKQHIVKTHSNYFDRVMDGSKTFELRLNDRDYQVGDTVILANFDPVTKEYRSSPEILVEITYIIHGPNFGIKKGYCCFSFKKHTQ